jgi:tetratricopeptide (TPR) repeat protein
MNTKFYSFLFATAFIFMLGCKSASKLYQKGDYDQAVEVAVKKLQKKPNDDQLKVLLQDAYHYAVDDHESRIRDLSNNSSDLRWESIYNQYASLQRLYEAIHHAPELNNIVHPSDYSSFLVTYGEKASNVHYELAMRWMDNADKQSYRNAYREFQLALAFKPNDIDIRQKMNDAYEAAVIHVVVLPIKQYNYSYSSFELRNFEDGIVRNLQNQTGNGFVKFYSGWNAGVIEPDQVIEMHFNNLNIGRIQDERNSKQVSKEVVMKEIVYHTDSVVKEYGRVNATITNVRRTMYSEGNLSLSIRDANGHWLWNDNFRGNHQWTTEFATYTGDERALSSEDKNLVSRREQYPPAKEEIIREITRQINNDLANRVRDFYNSY